MQKLFSDSPTTYTGADNLAVMRAKNSSETLPHQCGNKTNGNTQTSSRCRTTLPAQILRPERLVESQVSQPAGLCWEFQQKNRRALHDTAHFRKANMRSEPRGNLIKTNLCVCIRLSHPSRANGTEITLNDRQVRVTRGRRKKIQWKRNTRRWIFNLVLFFGRAEHVQCELLIVNRIVLH